MLWKSAPGFPDYHVSEDGLIKRVVPTIRGHRREGVRIGSVTAKGYRQITLYLDGSPHSVMVHKLVCTAFNGAKPEGKTMVAHNDGNKLNNSYKNLRWATSAENEKDKNTHGTLAKGEACGSAKLSEADVAEIRQDNRSQRAIAKSYGITQANVSCVKTLKTWRHVQ